MDLDTLRFLLAPFAASLILTGIHAYLGVHVVERGVIFVDLALAQIAALGTTAPVESVTIPSKAVLARWAPSGSAKKAAAHKVSARNRQSRTRCILLPPDSQTIHSPDEPNYGVGSDLSQGCLSLA